MNRTPEYDERVKRAMEIVDERYGQLEVLSTIAYAIMKLPADVRSHSRALWGFALREIEASGTAIEKLADLVRGKAPAEVRDEPAGRAAA